MALLLPIGWLLWSTLAAGPLAGSAALLVAGALVFVAVVGLAIAAVTGYMAGLIGASNSPVSGIGILAVLGASLMLLGLVGAPGGDATAASVAYALIVTGIVFGIATIANDNLQDLKTGQLVGATPWKQQVALIIGVVFGSLVIPPVLDLLDTAFGFAGAPNAGPNALAAPQAGLISALAKGMLGGGLNTAMLGWGAVAGVIFVLLDEALGRMGRLRLPPLAVGIGIYLPMSAILPVVIGARRRPSLRRARRSRPRSRVRQAPRRAGRDRDDRRREPVAGRLRRHRRRDRQRQPACDRRPRVRARRADRRDGGVRAAAGLALPRDGSRDDGAGDGVRGVLLASPRTASRRSMSTKANPTELSAMP